MAYILCIAEKSSVAGEIARAIGANERKSGYYEGNGYCVTWAIGHLVGLAEPEEYGYISERNIWKNEENRQKALRELPVFPEKFKLVVLGAARQHFDLIKHLMNDSECEGIIDCGNGDGEGHILQHFIRKKAGCRKPVKKFIAESMTEEAIRAAMDNLQDIEEYYPIIKGEYCRKIADWVLGVSFSRAASIMYNTEVDVARLQMPALYYVVKRYLEHINFTSAKYYSLRAELSCGIAAYWNEDKTGIFPVNMKDSVNRLTDRAAADRLCQQVEKFGGGKVTLLQTKYREVLPPLLYDITELEKDGNIQFGYTSDQVLQAAQSLYEIHKITTYPLSDSQYITHDLILVYKKRIHDILFHEDYKSLWSRKDNEFKINPQMIDDKKTTEYHAIIITDQFSHYPLSQLSETERNVLNLIVIRMLEAASDRQVNKETKIGVTFSGNIVFENIIKSVVRKGWTVINEMYSDCKDSGARETMTNIKDINIGDRLFLKSVRTVYCKSAPPKLHTEATLLALMENAGYQIRNGRILQVKGIGTPATRAAIIKQLFDKGYIINDGKTKTIVPTQKGLSVIKVLPPDIYSPKITAEWESEIARIVDGEMDVETFMSDFRTFINGKLEQLLKIKVQEVDFSQEKNVIGKCPTCGQNVYEGAFMDQNNASVQLAYCSSKNCQFYLRKDNITYKLRTGKNLTSSQTRALLEGKIIESRCISKLNKEYTGKFRMIMNKRGYADIEFIMPGRNK